MSAGRKETSIEHLITEKDFWRVAWFGLPLGFRFYSETREMRALVVLFEPVKRQCYFPRHCYRNINGSH